MSTIALGDTVKDSVSGFVGVAVAKTEWLNGCTRWTVQPPVDKEGKLPETATFDEPQLARQEVSDRMLCNFADRAREDNGGPLPFTPKQHDGPVR